MQVESEPVTLLFSFGKKRFERNEDMAPTANNSQQQARSERGDWGNESRDGEKKGYPVAALLKESA